MSQPDNVFSRINVNYIRLSVAEKKVADFVRSDPNKVLGTSITDLAHLCGVSDSTIFRFCRSLHFKGYQEFKTTLAQSVGFNTRDDEFQINVMNKKITKKDSLESVCLKLLTADLEALKETHSMIRVSEIEHAVEMLCNAKTIYFYGCGTTSVTAMHACNKFQRITPKAFYSADPNILSLRMSFMSQEDVVVILSYSGQCNGMEHVIESVMESHAKVICITRFTNSPITKYADIVLLCGADEGPFQAGSLSISIAQLYLIDILYTEYFKRTYNTSKENTNKTAKLLNI